MPHSFDFHFHSLYSDGSLMPEGMVASAAETCPGVTHLALTDHNTYLGCERFIAACRERGIEGFVSSEISGSHPDFTHIEFHVLATFGAEWTADVARRVDLFHPHWNRLRQVDIDNMFLWLDTAARLGMPVSYREVVRRTVRDFAEMPEPREIGIVQPTGFGHLRKVIRERGLETKLRKDSESLEKRVWREGGVKPAPTPPMCGAYDIFRAAGPAVTLAHPMIYDWTMDEARRVIGELKSEIGLGAMEVHYAGRFHPEWKVLADETGLLASAGSDCHSSGYGGLRNNKPSAGVPVVKDDETDFDALIDFMRSGGG